MAPACVISSNDSIAVDIQTHAEYSGSQIELQATRNNAAISGTGSLTECIDDLWFAVSDESPGRDAVYVFDPGPKVELRNSWVKHLEEIQHLQARLLIALQDPKRFTALQAREERSISAKTSLTGKSSNSLCCQPPSAKISITSLENFRQKLGQFLAHYSTFML
ncbi:hypothetical protein Ciccas_001384 [Cichlidogyrus casuarinus]|uniref:Uncharacterized protein n=1 Tax=Cichlidogyrus casuarinus TaxID=1844966 RepID=A0ABD2QK63_9PLAT